MTTLSEIEARAIRVQAIRDTVRYFARRTHDPARIGRRIILADWHFSDPATRPKQYKLAARLELPQSRVSLAISQLTEDILEM